MTYLADTASADVRERIFARIAQTNGPSDSDNAREIIAGKLVGRFPAPMEFTRTVGIRARPRIHQASPKHIRIS